jgi:hypothetical protein
MVHFFCLHGEVIERLLSDAQSRVVFFIGCYENQIMCWRPDGVVNFGAP